MPPRTRHYRRTARQCVRKNLFLILTALGILVGITLGFSLRPLKLSDDELVWLGMPGEIFMRSMRLMILPLIICSVISGTASLNPKSNGKISLIAVCLCVVNNAICSLLGLMFALIIRPGHRAVGGSVSKETKILNIQDIFADLLRNLIPDNIVEACFRQTQTQYVERKGASLVNVTTDNSTSGHSMILRKVVSKSDAPNILGLIAVCLLIGVATNKSGEKGRRFLEFFTSATEVVLIVLRWLMWYVPIGVCSLVAVSLATIDDLEQTFVQIGYLVLTVTVAIAVHQLIVVPLVLFFVAQRNPFRYMISQSRAWMIAFSTASPAIAIPEIIQVCEDVHKIDGRVVRFVVPLCTTLSAGGGSTYIVISAIFVATVSGTPLSAGGIAALLLLTIVAAMAIPSVPSASLVTLIVILTALQLPSTQLGFLFAVEWYLLLNSDRKITLEKFNRPKEDRIRSCSTLVNTAAAPGVVYRFCKKDLPPLDLETAEEKVLLEDIPQKVIMKSGPEV